MSVAQKELILSLLRSDPWGVCANLFLDVQMPRYAARIYELRREGYQITTSPCPHGWHTTRQVRYVLEGEPT